MVVFSYVYTDLNAQKEWLKLARNFRVDAGNCEHKPNLYQLHPLCAEKENTISVRLNHALGKLVLLIIELG